MAHHLLGVTWAGPCLDPAVKVVGIAEWAKVLMGPAMVFVVSIFATMPRGGRFRDFRRFRRSVAESRSVADVFRSHGAPACRTALATKS
jgi:hypothetical protein